MAYQTFTVTDKGLRLDYDLGDGKTKQKLLQTVPTSLDVGTTGTISQSDQGGIVLQGQGGAESFFQSGAAVDAYTSLADELAAQAQADTPTTDTTTDTGVFLTDEEKEAESRRLVEESQYGDTQELADELGIEGDVYTSLDEYLKDFVDSQSMQLETAQISTESARQSDRQSLADYTAASRSNVDAATTAFAPGREGIMSTGNISAISKYEQVAEERITSYAQQVSAAIQARNTALVNLEQAQKEGRTDLVQAYSGALAQAKTELMQIETDYFNALSDVADYELKKSAQTESALNSFTAMADTGVTLDPGTISSFADQLGISFDAALGYYEGAQAIRDDKSLDTATKAVELEKLNFDLQNEITGGALKEQQKLDYYTSQVRSGQYSKEEIESLAVMLDIPVAENPVYQAEKAVQAAELAYTKSGTAKNYQAVLDAQAERRDLYGEGGYIPESTVYGVTQAGNGILVDVTEGQPLDDPETERDEGQCGAFVNDVMGTKMGDTLASKLAFTDENITAPAAGMFFVRPGGYDLPAGQGDSGHTGAIEWVDLENGQMGVVDANVNNDGKVKRYTTTITSDMRFGVPVNGMAMDSAKQGGATVSDDLVVSAMLASNGGKTLTTVPAQNMIKAFTVINQLEALSEALELGKKQTFSAGTDPETGELLETDKIDFSPLTGFIESKNPWNADAKEVEAILTGTVPNVARGIFGEVGVLTDTDIALYKQTLPNLTQTDEVKTLVTAALLKTVSNGLGDQLETWAGLGYDVSGLVNKYQRVQQQVTALEESIGIGGSTNAGDQDLYDNGPIKQEQDELWDGV